jgi:oligoendopeptidase F
MHMSRLYNPKCLIGLAILSVSGAAAPADTFEPIPAVMRDDCHIDLKLFYQNEQARQKDVSSVRKGIGKLNGLRATIPADPKAILAALDMRSSMELELGRLWMYGQVVWRQDSDNGAARRESETLEAEVENVWTPIKIALSHMSESDVFASVKTEPGLKKYEWKIADWRRASQHMLPEREERILSTFETFTAYTVDQRANEILQGTDFGSIMSGGQPLPLQTNYDKLLASADRSIRQQAFVRYRTALAQRGNTFAENLLSEEGAAKDAASFRNFASALEGTYYGLYLTPDQVERILGVFTKRADLVGRFAEANRKYVAKNLGVGHVEPWDQRAPTPDFQEPRVSLPDAIDSIKRATKVFGDEYAIKLGALLNPTNHRLDLLPSPRKASQDVTLSPYQGGPSVFLTSGYRGRISDVIALAHEVAHGVHADLMEENHVMAFERDGPGYLFEGVAKVNELLILDELAARATDSRAKTFYLLELAARLAEVRYTTMFWAVVATKFEIQLAKKVASGQPTAQDVHAVWMRTNVEFDPSYADFPDNQYTWAVIPNFTSSPREYVKYLYAWMIAAALYEKAQTDPAALASLVVFMKGGITDEPFVLLKTRLGIDLNNPATLESALNLAEKRVQAFEMRCAESALATGRGRKLQLEEAVGKCSGAKRPQGHLHLEPAVEPAKPPVPR